MAQPPKLSQRQADALLHLAVHQSGFGKTSKHSGDEAAEWFKLSTCREAGPRRASRLRSLSSALWVAACKANKRTTTAGSHFAALTERMVFAEMQLPLGLVGIQRAVFAMSVTGTASGGQRICTDNWSLLRAHLNPPPHFLNCDGSKNARLKKTVHKSAGPGIRSNP